MVRSRGTWTFLVICWPLPRQTRQVYAECWVSKAERSYRTAISLQRGRSWGNFSMSYQLFCCSCTLVSILLAMQPLHYSPRILCIATLSSVKNWRHSFVKSAKSVGQRTSMRWLSSERLTWNASTACSQVLMRQSTTPSPALMVSSGTTALLITFFFM